MVNVPVTYTPGLEAGIVVNQLMAAFGAQAVDHFGVKTRLRGYDFITTGR